MGKAPVSCPQAGTCGASTDHLPAPRSAARPLRSPRPSGPIAVLLRGSAQRAAAGVRILEAVPTPDGGTAPTKTAKPENLPHPPQLPKRNRSSPELGPPNASPTQHHSTRKEDGGTGNTGFVIVWAHPPRGRKSSLPSVYTSGLRESHHYSVSDR